MVERIKGVFIGFGFCVQMFFSMLHGAWLSILLRNWLFIWDIIQAFIFPPIMFLFFLVINLISTNNKAIKHLIIIMEIAQKAIKNGYGVIELFGCLQQYIPHAFTTGLTDADITKLQKLTNPTN